MANPTLHYDRKTVNLVIELKRSLSVKEQADFKLTNPDLIHKIKRIYKATSKKSTRALAKRILEKAARESKKSSDGGLLAMIKSQVSNVHPRATKSSAKTKKQRIYRGQVID